MAHYSADCEENNACICSEYVNAEVTVYYDEDETNSPN